MFLLTLLSLLWTLNIMVWTAIFLLTPPDPGPPTHADLWHDLHARSQCHPCALCEDPAHTWEEHMERAQADLAVYEQDLSLR